MRSRRGRAGFTLVELMITLAVAAILLTLAAPSFLNFLVSSRLSAAADGMVAAIDTTRMAAISRNAGAQFCGSLAEANSAADALDPTGQLAAGCTSADAGPGAVYTVVHAAPSRVLAASSALASLQLSSPVVALRCNSQGVCSQTGTPATPYSDDVAVLCSSRLSTNNRYAIRMTGGSVTQIVKTTGACP